MKRIVRAALHLLALGIGLGALPAAARAQCSDGSPPPCGARAAPRAIDANLIAILPFHVTTSDTLLGEGFAELLASEFTGEGAPRALDMGTVLAEWRRSGARPRAPLPRSRAAQLARSLGAGWLAEGSVVGLGRQMTITTRVLDARTGNPRGDPVRVTTHTDSLDAALRLVASGLLATFGSGRERDEGARFTASPLAMRHYLRGLAEYRRGQLLQSAASLDAAIELDSSFAQAIHRRFLVQLWSVPGRVTDSLVWKHRERLGRHERAVVEMFLGAAFPALVAMPQQLLTSERLASTMGDSPEVTFWAADQWMHFGAVLDPDAHLRRARERMLRAYHVDSQAVTVRHLAEIGLAMGDTSLLRPLLPILMRSRDAGRTPYAWIVAARLGDQRALTRLRGDTAFETSVQNFSGLGIHAGVPASAMDELFALWMATLRDPTRVHGLRSVRMTELVSRGRLREAELLSRETDVLRDQYSYIVFVLGLSEGLPGLNMDSLAAVVAASPRARTDPTRRCVVALWGAQRGDTTVRWQDHVPGVPGCAWAIAHVQETRGGDVRAIAASDSLLRAGFERHLRGFESVLLARAWERAGDLDRALSAIRLRPIGFTAAAMAPWTYHEEGRLAALAGDRVGAIRAYSRYLELIAGADPVYDERKRAVLAELTRLSR